MNHKITTKYKIDVRGPRRPRRGKKPVKKTGLKKKKPKRRTLQENKKRLFNAADAGDQLAHFCTFKQGCDFPSQLGILAS